MASLVEIGILREKKRSVNLPVICVICGVVYTVVKSDRDTTESRDPVAHRYCNLTVQKAGLLSTGDGSRRPSVPIQRRASVQLTNQFPTS